MSITTAVFLGSVSDGGTVREGCWGNWQHVPCRLGGDIAIVVSGCKARGCSTNTFVTNWLTPSVIEDDFTNFIFYKFLHDLWKSYVHIKTVYRCLSHFEIWDHIVLKTPVSADYSGNPGSLVLRANHSGNFFPGKIWIFAIFVSFLASLTFFSCY